MLTKNRLRLFIYFFPIARCLWFRKRFESQFRFSELWSCLLGSECHMVLKIEAKVVISRFKKLKFRGTYFRGQAIFCIFRGTKFRGKGQKTRKFVPRKFVPAKISSLKVVGTLPSYIHYSKHFIQHFEFLTFSAGNVLPHPFSVCFFTGSTHYIL